MINVQDIMANYRRECELQGPARIRLLELSIAGAVAYGAPVIQGEPLDGPGFYRTVVYSRAMDVVGAINECVVIDTNCVLNLARDLWLERYGVLNDPRPGLHCSRFNELLKTNAFDLTSQYTKWVMRFIPVARSAFLAQ